MTRFVSSVTANDALGHGVTAKAGAAMAVPGADADDPMCDLAAFPLEPSTALHPLRVTAGMLAGSKLYLAARLRKGAPPGTWLFPGFHVGTAGDERSAGVDEGGALVGMVVRFQELTSGAKMGFLLPAEKIWGMLLAAAWGKQFG